MKIKFPTGTTAENNQLLLPEGMLSVDTEKRALRIHDGQTQGGFEVLGVKAIREPLLPLTDVHLKTTGFLYDVIGVSPLHGADPV